MQCLIKLTVNITKLEKKAVYMKQIESSGIEMKIMMISSG